MTPKRSRSSMKRNNSPRVVETSSPGMLDGLNDASYGMFRHLKMSGLFAAGAVFPVLALAGSAPSLGIGFIQAAAAVGFAVSVLDR